MVVRNSTAESRVAAAGLRVGASHDPWAAVSKREIVVPVGMAVGSSGVSLGAGWEP